MDILAELADHGIVPVKAVTAVNPETVGDNAAGTIAGQHGWRGRR